jgi:hypothetical protein
MRVGALYIDEFIDSGTSKAHLYCPLWLNPNPVIVIAGDLPPFVPPNLSMKAGKYATHSCIKSNGMPALVTSANTIPAGCMDATRICSDPNSLKRICCAINGQVGTGQRIIVEEFTVATLVTCANEQT